MNPGRELDALIAEKVMGWRYYKERGSSIYQLIPPNGEISHIDNSPPHYSTRISAAWEVVERFKKMGWVVTIESDAEMKDESPYFVSINPRYSGNENYLTVTASKYDAPHAICLAALKTVEIES